MSETKPSSGTAPGSEPSSAEVDDESAPVQDAARDTGRSRQDSPADAQAAGLGQHAVVRGGAAAALQGEGVGNPLKETLASRVDEDEVEAARAEVERRRAQVSVKQPVFSDTLKSAMPLELSEPPEPTGEDAPAGSIPVESAPSDREFVLPDSDAFSVVELPEPPTPDGLGSSDPETIRRDGPLADTAVAEPPSGDTEGEPRVPEPGPPSDEPLAPSDGPTLPCNEPLAPSDGPTLPYNEPVPPSDDPTPPSDEQDPSTRRRGAEAEPPPSSIAPRLEGVSSRLWLRVLVLLVLVGIVALLLARGLSATP